MRIPTSQVDAYEKDGILFPIFALTSPEAAAYRSHFENLESNLGGPRRNLHSAHICCDWAYRLATCPNVLDAVESVIGPEILIDDTAFFCKNPGDIAKAPWHQDGVYGGWQSTAAVTAWLAVTDSSPANGCMRVVPGTHLGERHSFRVLDAKDSLFNYPTEIEATVDESQVLDVELRAGEFSLHHASIVHGSEAFRSGDRRIGFVVRYVTPAFQQRPNKRPATRARGTADCGVIPLLANPPSGPPEQSAQQLRELIRTGYR